MKGKEGDLFPLNEIPAWLLQENIHLWRLTVKNASLEDIHIPTKFDFGFVPTYSTKVTEEHKNIVEIKPEEVEIDFVNTKLEKLEIINCPNFKNIPLNIERLWKLKILNIRNSSGTIQNLSRLKRYYDFKHLLSSYSPILQLKNNIEKSRSENVELPLFLSGDMNVVTLHRAIEIYNTIINELNDAIRDHGRPQLIQAFSRIAIVYNPVMYHGLKDLILKFKITEKIPNIDLLFKLELGEVLDPEYIREMHNMKSLQTFIFRPVYDPSYTSLEPIKVQISGVLTKTNYVGNLIDYIKYAPKDIYLEHIGDFPGEFEEEKEHQREFMAKELTESVPKRGYAKYNPKMFGM